MPEIKNPMVQNFISHFLLPDSGRHITEVKELLDLPLKAFKVVNPQEILILTENNFKVIRDLSLATPERLENISKKHNFDSAKLKKIFVACKLQLIYVRTLNI